MAEKAACRAQFSLSEVYAGCSKSLCVTTGGDRVRERFSSDSTGTAATGKGFTGRRRAIELVAEHGFIHVRVRRSIAWRIWPPILRCKEPEFICSAGAPSVALTMFAHIISAVPFCGKNRIAWRWEHYCLCQPKGNRVRGCWSALESSR